MRLGCEFPRTSMPQVVVQPPSPVGSHKSADVSEELNITLARQETAQSLGFTLGTTGLRFFLLII
jgi:hypothetical protein